MRRGFLAFAAVVLLAVPALEAGAAEPVSLFLKLNGKEIKGESAQASLGRADSIECASYEQEVTTGTDSRTGMDSRTAVATGRRQQGPIKILKRIDRSSPLLLKGLIHNEKAEASFWFFRPSPKGDGTMQQFYRVDIKDAFISSVKQIVPKITDPVTAPLPPLEEVTFTFRTISWTFTEGGITAADSLTTAK